MGFRWIFVYPWIDNVRYVKGQYIRSLKGLYESNYMASWLEFAKYIGKIQHQATYTFFSKIWSFFLKEQYGSTHIILDSNFSNDAQNSSIYIYLERSIWFRLYSFDQNSEFARKYWKTKLRNTKWWRLMKILWKDDIEPLSFVSLLQYS